MINMSGTILSFDVVCDGNECDTAYSKQTSGFESTCIYSQKCLIIFVISNALFVFAHNIAL